MIENKKNIPFLKHASNLDVKDTEDIGERESKIKASRMGNFQTFCRLHRPFGKDRRKLIFALVFVINLLINIDHGAIPAATTMLKQELHLDNVALGVIGSLVYLGLVLGAISAGPIFKNYSSKWVVSLSLLFSCFFLYFFTITKDRVTLSICRVGCGFFQVNKGYILFFETYILYYLRFLIINSRFFALFTFLFGSINMEYMNRERFG